MKLGVRLVLVSVISVVLSSVIIGVASYISTKKNFEKNALSVLNDSKLILQNYLKRLHDQAYNASMQIIARDEIKATVILVRDYEDPDHYDPMIFSGEKIKVVRELSQYITIPHDLSYSIYDARGNLLGSAMQTSGEKSLMFVSYEKGQPVCNFSKQGMIDTFEPKPFCSQRLHRKFNDEHTDRILYEEERVYLSETVPIKEQEGNQAEIIGYFTYSIEIGQDMQKVLGELAGITLEYSVEPPRGSVYEEDNHFFMDVPLGFEGDLSSWRLAYDKTSMTREIENAFYLILEIMLVSLMVSAFLGVYYAHKNIEKPVLNLIERIHAFQAKHVGSDMEKPGLQQQDELVLLREYFINMEKQVDTAIAEVKNLNEELQMRVESEVQRVREKDEMLITQSKNAALGEMINNIAHQWRQPITSIGLLVQNLEDAYEEGRLTKEYMRNAVEKSLRQIEYMSQTINDFRNFFKTTKTKKKFSLRKSLDSVMGLAFPQLTQELEVHIEGEDIVLYGLENEFKQVILNVMMNSKDAILERVEEGKLKTGKILIEIFQDSENVEVKISDNGGGMSPEIMDRIFEPYFTTKFKKQGTGIGLYMTKAIVEKHMMGKISARNIEGGAEFSIRFPQELND